MRFCSLFLVLTLLFLPTLSPTQSIGKQRKQAMIAEENKQYLPAARLYAELAEKSAYPRAALDASRCFALANDKEQAFHWLFRTVKTFPYFSGLEKYREEYNSLKDDPRWQTLLNAYHKARSRDLSAEEKIYGLSLFWKEAKENFVYFDKIPDLDWDKAYREYIPKVLATKSRFAYVRLLQKFCALLKDGHTNIFIPSDLNPWGLLPVRFVEFDKRFYVSQTSEQLKNEIFLASELVAVNGKPVQEYVTQEVLPYISSSTEHILWREAGEQLSAGEKGKQIKIVLKAPQGTVRTYTLRFEERHFGTKMVGITPPEFVRSSYRELPNNAAYVSLNTFADPGIVTDFEAMLPKLTNCKGLIIDIRQNGGGDGAIAGRIASYLTNTPLEGSRWRTRKQVSAYKAWGYFESEAGDEGGYVPYFEGKAWQVGEVNTILPAKQNRIVVPTLILTDYSTASAAEDFLIYLDKAPHVWRVGRRTYGSTGQPLFLQLPGNITARICAKRDTYPDGKDFVGVGIRPFEQIIPHMEDFFAKRDPILRKAEASIQGSIYREEELTHPSIHRRRR